LLRPFKADLHIHTCLSPCTELDMSPKGILLSAKEKGIDILGICDHNSTENSLGIMNAAERTNIHVIPGLEVTSQEEVHVLALKLLIGATTIPLDKVLKLIHSFDGITIASHIDRESFSIIGQLGFIPENLELDALEISPHMAYAEAKKKFKDHYPIISSSDAHYPDDIGKVYTSFLLEDGSVAEIKKALKNEDGRKLIH